MPDRPPIAIGDKVRVKVPSPGTNLPPGSVWTIAAIGPSGNYRLAGDKIAWRHRSLFDVAPFRPGDVVERTEHVFMPKRKTVDDVYWSDKSEGWCFRSGGTGWIASYYRLVEPEPAPHGFWIALPSLEAKEATDKACAAAAATSAAMIEAQRQHVAALDALAKAYYDAAAVARAELEANA
jgi:hypothetical protein